MISILKIGSITDVNNNETWSSELILKTVNARVNYLQGNGVTKGDIILIKHGGTPSFFADLFAVWKVGAVAACLNPGISILETNNIISFLNAKWLLLGGDATLELPGIDERVTVLRLSDADSMQFDKRYLQNDDSTPVLQDDIALLLFTSGTTGIPKGVAHTFRSLLTRITLNNYHIDSEEQKETLCPLPTHFGHGLIGNCLTPLLNGNNIYLVPGGNLTTASQLGAIIDKYNITFMSSVPSMWKVTLRMSAKPQKETLKRVHVGSAPLSKKMWEDIIAWTGTDNVCNMYGITETANWIASASSREFAPEDGLIGKLWGGQIAVLTDEGHIRADGEGQLLVQTPSVMHSYYELPEQTSECLREGWFNTGDIGRIDEDGIIKLTGRKKYEINRGGMKVHPEDIDLLLETNENVLEACSFGIADDISGEVVGVAVVLKDDTIDLSVIKSWLLENLVREKNPERWYVVKEIPKTDRGKINRDNVALYCLEQNK